MKENIRLFINELYGKSSITNREFDNMVTKVENMIDDGNVELLTKYQVTAKDIEEELNNYIVLTKLGDGHKETKNIIQFNKDLK